MDLKLPASELDRISTALLAFAPEEGAAFLAVQGSGPRMVLRSTKIFDRAELEAGEFGELTLSEDAQMSGLAEIKRSGAGLVEVHTHPGSRERVRFSSFDEDQLPRFARYFSNKLPGRPFGALVLGNSGYEGRYWNGESFEPLNLEPVGERRRIPAWASTGVQVAVKPQFDRQVRALGVEGQRRLSALRVGVVGLGGTGSQVVQQLSHLGVRKLILVDADRVEDTNLPRLA